MQAVDDDEIGKKRHDEKKAKADQVIVPNGTAAEVTRLEQLEALLAPRLLVGNEIDVDRCP